METILAIAAGIALAAACGFRIFVPLLATSLAVHFGHLSPSSGLDWVGSTPAVILLSVATAMEVAGYYIPWVDNALDSIASPAAVVAGTIAAATAFGDINPAFKWALALIAGGGIAAGVQGSTVVARAASTATTGGAGNPIVATIELVGSVITAILAIVLPIIGLLVAIVLGVVLYRVIRRMRRKPVAATVCLN